MTQNHQSSNLALVQDSHAMAIACEILTFIEQGLGIEFSMLDGVTGEILWTAQHQPACDWSAFTEICREVIERRRPEFIAEEGPLWILAIPFFHGDMSFVALRLFVTRPVIAGEDMGLYARRLGLRENGLASWVSRQTPWSSEALLRVAGLATSQWTNRQRIKEAGLESHTALQAAICKETDLLHNLIHNLKIANNDDELGHIVLGWVSAVFPVELLAIQYLPMENAGLDAAQIPCSMPAMISMGQPLLTPEEFARLVGCFSSPFSYQPVAVNVSTTQAASWPFSQVRQLIVVPLTKSGNLFGWLMVFNHVNNKPFNASDVSLLGSVGAILGIYRGRNDYYSQQSMLLTDMLRSLTSAIDTKDLTTYGHCSRVAMIAMRLAQSLGCDNRALNTIYQAGMLHDIGKIGIDDTVLHKPGKLSDTEFEYIKQHVTIGHRLLWNIESLDEVLPIVLHHHESWDGRGYPDGLAAHDIPFLARVLAVADAYDAMSCDRPYRRGLSDEKIDEIFRAGEGKQWDPVVVTAFFQLRNSLGWPIHNGAQLVVE